MKNKIKYVLCNENGGPNLENLLAIAISLALLVGINAFKNAAYTWLQVHQSTESNTLAIRTNI